MTTTVTTLTAVAALCCAAVGGVFYAFSSFVMDGLGRLPDTEGSAAMRAINVAAPRPAFMAGLFGTALLCLVVAVLAVLRWQGAASALALTGAAVYLVGVVVLTVAYHVPQNDALAAGTVPWRDYLHDWTLWNHVRAVAGVAAGGLLLVAVRLG